MSEGSADGFSDNYGGKKICRDFQRGVCRRTQCKFQHDLSSCPPDTSRVMFCHDFQNRTCTRLNCKFLHYSVADEVYYRQNGRFPHPVENRIRERENGGPACKDYILGTCRRGLDCKYRHISYTQFQEENGHLENGENDRVSINSNRNRNELYDSIRNSSISHNNSGSSLARINGFSSLNNDEEKQNGSLVRWNGNVSSDGNGRLSYMTYSNIGNNPNSGLSTFQRANGNLLYESRNNMRLNNEYTVVESNGYDTYEPPPKRRFYEIKDHSFYNRMPLEEQNIMLMKELEDLRKQVSDLTATNEFLLEQNAQLRMGGSRQGNLTAVTVPAVTITNTTVPPTTQSQPQVIRTVTASVATVPVSIAAVSMAPVQVSAPIVSMATPQTQIIANSTPIAIANSSQQLALAQQSLAGTGNAPNINNQIIASSTQQQILASNTQLTISNAQPTGQQILTPIGAPGQQLAMAQQSLAHNTSQAIALSNASQPIISYPIMTQSILPH